MKNSRTRTRPSDPEAQSRMWPRPSPNIHIRINERGFRIRSRVRCPCPLSPLIHCSLWGPSGGSTTSRNGSAAKSSYLKTRRRIRDGSRWAMSERTTQSRLWRPKWTSETHLPKWTHLTRWAGWSTLDRSRETCRRWRLKWTKCNHKVCSELAVPANLPRRMKILETPYMMGRVRSMQETSKFIHSIQPFQLIKLGAIVLLSQFHWDRLII